MKLFKNKESIRFIAAVAAISAAACIVCLLIDPRAAAVCLGLGVCVVGICIWDAERRLRNMAKLADSLDRMLEGAEGIELKNYREGELGILENELTKLTVRLREQTAELKKDKELLADSIADISHQIRTPLTALNLIRAALCEPEVTEEKQRELLADMHRQLSRIDWLVSALLKLARLDADSVKMSPALVELSALVNDALAPVAIQMELKNQQPVVSAAGSAYCDRSWTAEALGNIIKNCSEHMGEGRLYITAEENPLYSQIVIRDSGSGIAKEDLPHIFERFYKGRNSGKNSIGIGLALCRMIIVRQNGTVRAENAKEGGAVFTVRIYKSAVQP